MTHCIYGRRTCNYLQITKERNREITLDYYCIMCEQTKMKGAWFVYLSKIYLKKFLICNSSSSFQSLNVLVAFQFLSASLDILSTKYFVLFFN